MVDTTNQDALHFDIGRRYVRSSDIHDRFGGSRQSGISVSASYPAIFLFTGRSGAQYGYADSWTDDGTYLYTGEGRTGDMAFTRGNRAIRDHLANGKDLHLFETAGKGDPCRYVGTFICAGWHQDKGPDWNGTTRNAIVFHLIPLEDVGNSSQIAVVDVDGLSLSELRKRALRAAENSKEQNVSQSHRNFYVRSKTVQKYVLARANGVCECCGSSAPFLRRDGRPYLEPHHIQRLSDGGPDHPRSVAGICPNCHREIHFGKHGREINKQLADKVRELET